MLTIAAMLFRNTILLGILAAPTLAYAAVPLLLMLLACMGSVFVRFGPDCCADANIPTLQINSPFSLSAASKFGPLFVTLDVAGTVGQRSLGAVGFYAVSFVGGLISSASSVASAGTLAVHGHFTPQAVGHGTVLAALASVFIKWPLVLRIGMHKLLTKLLAQALGRLLPLE